MAKSISEINRELFAYQCCLADKAVLYIYKEMRGQSNIECELNKLIYYNLLLEQLSCPDAILDLEQLSQEELEANVEKLNSYCGCMTCGDPSDMLDDTLPTGLRALLNSGGGAILLS